MYMKRIEPVTSFNKFSPRHLRNISAALLFALGCNGPTTSPLNGLMIDAVNPRYSLSGGVASLSLTMRVTNKENVSAKRGCGISIERDTGSGYQVVSLGACLNSDGSGVIIPPDSTAFIEVTRTLSASDVDENASYRLAMTFSFAPEFKSGLPFQSAPFKLSR